MHTLIPKSSTFADSVGNTFNNPSVVRESGAFPNMMNGMTSSKCSAFDQRHMDAITNNMFKPAGATFGLDLLALNIQRGRDHGLPSYNRWRQVK